MFHGTLSASDLYNETKPLTLFEAFFLIQSNTAEKTVVVMDVFHILIHVSTLDMENSYTQFWSCDFKMLNYTLTF